MARRHFDEGGLAEPAIAIESISPGALNPGTVPLLNALCRLAGKLDALDTSQSEAPAAAVVARFGELRVVLKRTVQHLQALDHLLHDTESDLEICAEPESATFGGESFATPAPPQVADVCFCGIIELNRSIDQLLHAHAFDDVLVAAETALRKLRRVIQAVLAAAQERGLIELVSGAHLRQHRGFDLNTTLAVRRLYAEFRRGLRSPNSDTPEAVFGALRYAAGALAAMFSSPHYRHARVSDRSLLRRLQQRVLAWARGDKTLELGLHLLEDVRTCADLLRGINRRQELRAHDEALFQQLSAGPGGQTEQWLSRVRLLWGLDDGLDALLARAQSAGGDAEDLVPQVLAQLATLR